MEFQKNETFHSGGELRLFSGIFQGFGPEKTVNYATVVFIVAKNGGFNGKTAIHKRIQAAQRMAD